MFVTSPKNRRTGIRKVITLGLDQVCMLFFNRVQ